MAGYQQSKEQRFPTGDSFDAQGTYVMVWRPFWFLQLGGGVGGCYWHLENEEDATDPTIYKMAPTTKNSPNINTTELGKPWYGALRQLSHWLKVKGDLGLNCPNNYPKLCTWLCPRGTGLRPQIKMPVLELISINIQRLWRFFQSAVRVQPINCIWLSIMRGNCSHRYRPSEVMYLSSIITARGMLIHWCCNLIPARNII